MKNTCPWNGPAKSMCILYQSTEGQSMGEVVPLVLHGFYNYLVKILMMKSVAT